MSTTTGGSLVGQTPLNRDQAMSSKDDVASCQALGYAFGVTRVTSPTTLFI